MYRRSPHSPTAIISSRRAVWYGPAAPRRYRRSLTCSTAISASKGGLPLATRVCPYGHRVVFTPVRRRQRADVDSTPPQIYGLNVNGACVILAILENDGKG